MSRKLVSSLKKSEILQLPGMTQYRTKTIKELRSIVKNNIINVFGQVNNRGITVDNYNTLYNKYNVNQDNQLFKKIRQTKRNTRQKQIHQEQYQNQIKQSALEERQFIDNINNISTDIYANTKDKIRRDYENRIKGFQKNKEFKKFFGNMMKNVSNDVGFEVDIGDSDYKRLAFTETLRQIYKGRYNKKKAVVKAFTIDDNYRWFTLSKEHDIESTIGHISGDIDLSTNQSDSNPYVMKSFVPVRYQLMFLDINKSKDGVKFNIKKQDPKTKRIFNEEVELDEDYRETPEGSFFPYINLSKIDLSPFQIFHNIDQKNYQDNCFVYACIQSKVFTEDEIAHLRYTVQTRSIPNNKILEISQQFQCNFVVKRIDENFNNEQQQQVKIDTRKKAWAKSFKRTIELLLYKDHYMLYQRVPATIYYLEHAEELEKNYPQVPLNRLMLVNGIIKKRLLFKEDGTLPMKIFRKMFELKLFKEILSCELNILNTTEYDHLNDYDNLEFNEKLCCKLIDSKEEKKKERTWTRIYYSDFETDTTLSPHVPYLNCTIYRDKANIHKINFLGENSGEQLLDYLISGSLTYFHNLKYDACFFINTPGWKTEITERSGTVLQIVMTKYDSRECIDPKTKRKKTLTTIIKNLVFRNSYSIIPSALANFASMFNLKVHKDLMPYRLYTQRNIKRKNVSALEFQLQYFLENQDKLSKTQIKNNWNQLMENANIADAFNKENLTVDIVKYAIFYCQKDCIVLMKGLEKFDEDLRAVFNSTNTKMLNVHNFISISSIGYHFAHKFGCFDGCYELSGKPQNFIQRCVSGGRTMTAANKKQYIEGKIQDFDAVSLYPSAMYVMDGVPKGIPKIIPSDILREELMSLDTFFIEINITKIQCKSPTPYKFGQVFRRNDAGSKIFDNNPIDHFYIDKVGLLDLMEFYDIEFELIRGYYFDQGFNTKINVFIEGLFNLRLKYKKEKNPLQSTIKLLLNSIYGKSILKAMKTETKSVPRDEIFKYIWRNYNYISEIIDEPTIDKMYVKRIKPINKHFNLPQFGATVLSWSKHLMNRVMGSAEQAGIPIFYQDTDSMHLFEKDVPKVASIFKSKYQQKLIGENMCQFHNDFDPFPGSVGNVYSRKLIALGKKSYLDILVDEEGHEGYHIRLKGIPHQVILNKCKRMQIGVEELFERLYRGEEITFNLLDGSNAFRKTKSFMQTNLPAFNRKLKFI